MTVRCGFILIVLAVTIGACHSETNLPYRAWRLGFLAPNNMEVWTEDAIVEDVAGNVFHGYQSGTVQMRYDPNDASWPDPPGWGKGREVVQAALPRRIYVRWQSLVEPKTYAVTLELSDAVRQQMLKQAPSMLHVPDVTDHRPEYYEAIAIGLAPGGIVKVWVTGAGVDPIAVMCVKAKVEPKGPYDGLSNGKYRPLTERPQPYLKNHAIPYGTWGC